MRYFIFVAACLLLAPSLYAQRIVTKGATDVNSYITIIDSADGTPETGVTSATSGIDLEYVRAGAAPVDLTESNLGSTSAAHTDGGLIHVGGGRYRVDIPDAAFATGVDAAYVQGTVTGMIVIGETFQLTDLNLKSSFATQAATALEPINILLAEKPNRDELQTSEEILNVFGTSGDLDGDFTAVPAAVWASGTRTITGGTITTYTGNTPQTGDSFARLGAPSGASISADIATKPSAATIADAVWDEATSGHVTAGTYSTLIGQIDGNVTDIELDVDAVLVDTAYMQPRVPASGTLATAADVAATAAGTRDTRDFDEVQHVWVMQRKGDGSWRSTPESTLYLVANAEGTGSFRAGFDCNIPSIIPNGSVLASMTDPTSEHDEFTLAELGIGPNGTRQPMLAKVEIDLDANATPGTYWIKTRVTNSLGGGPSTLYGKVVILEAPDE